jgi:putative two-component system hydrogenase maturation factor HypX/HoxX
LRVAQAAAPQDEWLGARVGGTRRGDTCREAAVRILLVASAFNSLTQRVMVELADQGHAVAVELALGDDDALRTAARRHAPELIVAPMLKSAIPRDLWSAYPCLVVHPGPVGDRGPSSLDWAVQEGATEWGVTVLQAEAEMDAGPVWASVPCPVPPVGKSDLYRNEIADAALAAVHLAVRRFATGFTPVPQVTGRVRPAMRQDDRRIDWAADDTGTVLRKLRAADSQPGVLDELLGREWYLHGGHPEDRLRGRPGELLAARDGAVCRATADGAVWIPGLRPRPEPGAPRTFVLPAATALGPLLPELPQAGDWSEIRYREQGEAGFLSFAFAGGAMSTEQCRRLLRAYRAACTRPTSVLVLGSRRDFFSNGIHLNVIEAAADPAAESWANINAIDDLAEAVLTTTDRLVVAALGGNAAAGGAMLALAADEVWCRAGAVLNPHYRLMGLPGSEFWTYTLPRRVGAEAAARLTERALPVGADAAQRLGLVDQVIACPPGEFADQVAERAAALARHRGTGPRIAEKKAALERAQREKPLAEYRAEELARMRAVFDDPDAPYHALRRAFVRKERPGCTPEHLAALPRRAAAPAGDR